MNMEKNESQKRDAQGKTKRMNNMSKNIINKSIFAGGQFL